MAMIATVSVVAGGARVGRDAISDAVNPIANATIVPIASSVGPSSLVTIGKSTQHDVDRGADGLFYVRIMVNDHPVRFLVDTGASVVVLTAADARAVGIEISDKHYDRSVDTVGGSTPMAWTTLETVDIAGHRIRGLRAAVVRGGLGVSLMGQNMLSRLDSVTMTADRLSLR